MKFLLTVDIHSMKGLPLKYLRHLADRGPILLSVALFSLLLFQFFAPDRTELTAASSQSSAVSEQIGTNPSAAPVVLEQISTELKRGSTLQGLLLNSGVPSADVSKIIKAVSPYLDLTRMKPGQKVEIFFDKKLVEKIIVPASSEKDIRVSRVNENTFRAEEYIKDLFLYPIKKTVRVDSSLYGSAVDAGIPDKVVMDLIMLFSFDVDFQRDIHRGDELTAVYELMYDENNIPVDTGNILEAELKANDQHFKIYRYVSVDGAVDFYDENGHTIRKTLLKTPINGAYITSNFGRRISPISGFSKMHKGVDFGAPKGSPIKASGDGTVVFAGYNKVYGNHVILRHVNHYETLYGHMTSFARSIRRGVRVNQGQVIGYVGSTGMSTGPHLHYEVHYYGEQVNPSTMKFPPGRSLQGEELRLYQNRILSLNAAF